MIAKRWYHYLLEFFGFNTGVWYRVRYAAYPIPKDLKFKKISKEDSEI